MKYLFMLLAALSLSACSGNLLFDVNPSAATTTAATQQAIYLRSLWVVGGLSGNGVSTVVGQVDVFDPVTSTWYPAVTTLPVPVSFAGVAGYQGKIYVIGGFDGTGTNRNLVQIYTIATNTWTTGATITAACADIQAIAIAGYIYVTGGTTGANATTNWAGANTTYRYYIAGNTWSTQTAPGAASSDYTSCVYGGAYYLLGYRSAAATMSTTTNAYIPVVGGIDVLSTGVTETLLTTAKIGMVGDVYVTSAGTAYIILAGGVTAMTGTTGCMPFYGTTTYSPTNAVQYLAYPFSAGAAWQTLAQSLPLPLGHGAGLIKNGIFYHMGGTATGIVTSPPSGMNTLYYSNLSTFPSNTWQTGPAMPIGRYGHRVVQILQN